MTATVVPITFAALSIEEDASAHHAEWDAFLREVPGGHHAQSSRWAQVKAVLGWDAVRLIARRSGRVVGGVQLLRRDLGRIGAVGFAPRGPVVAPGEDEALGRLHEQLLALGRRERLRYLKVQPPCGLESVRSDLIGLGWAPSTMEAAPTASIRVDLRGSEDEILGRMRKNTRNYIRQAPRRGLEIRVGGEADLPTYYEMVSETSRRQGFAPYPLAYYEQMWRAFAQDGSARMFLAESGGDVLSATLVIGFGDHATYKMGGWSGIRAKANPNEAIQWAGMSWAREAGFSFYDFDGINLKAARMLVAGEELPDELRAGVTAFKLQFGGDAVVFPGALDTSPSAPLRFAVRAVAPRMDRLLPLAHRALGRG